MSDTTRPDGMTVIDGSYPFEVKSGLNGNVGVLVKNESHTLEAYFSGHMTRLEGDAVRMIPVLEAWLAKCREVSSRQSVGTLATDLAGRIAEHAAAT